MAAENTLVLSLLSCAEFNMAAGGAGENTLALSLLSSCAEFNMAPGDCFGKLVAPQPVPMVPDEEGMGWLKLPCCVAVNPDELPPKPPPVPGD